MSSKDNPNKGRFDPKLLGRVLALIKEKRPLFYLSIVLTFLVASAGPAVPFMVRTIIDEAVLKQDTPLLVDLSVAMLGLLIVQTLLTYSQTLTTNLIGQFAIKELRLKVFGHISRFRMSVFDRTQIGTLITRTVSDVEKVADIFAQGLINIVGDMLQMLIIMGIMFYINWQLTLVVLVVFPLLVASGWIFKEAVKVSFREVRNQISRLNAFLQERITGIHLIQIFNREEEELKRFKEISKDELSANLKAVLYYSIFFPAIEILSAVSVAALVWFGSGQVLQGELSFGDITSFILFINLLFRPVRQIADKFNTLQMGLVASERIFQVLETDEQIDDEGELAVEQLKGKVSFKNVYFGYKPDEEILRGISFEVEPGQMLAIVGSTGAGKSTIIGLINRLYQINSGAISIDDHDVSAYQLKSLRQNIAVVLQDVFLFSDTIENNISLYNPSITREQIIEAAKMVGVHDFIMRLPGGYDYVVQERGATLSAGQRQLVSFIRALVHNPGILILDEATSSVDNETEELLQHATEIMLRGRTSIVVAHRLSTIQKADKILVLDKGQIIEQGSHQELLKMNGAYKRLYQLQFEPVG